MSDPRLEITEHFVRAQAKFVSEKAKQVLIEHGSFPPTFLIACRESPIDGEQLDAETSLVPVIHRGDFGRLSKETTIAIARCIALAGKAMAAIVAMNSWAVFVKGDRDKQMRVYDDIRSGRVRLDEHPDRREVIIVIIEWDDERIEVVSAVSPVRDQGFVDFDDVREEMGAIQEMNDALSIVPPKSYTPPPGLIDDARLMAAEILKDKRQELREAAARGEIARG